MSAALHGLDPCPSPPRVSLLAIEGACRMILNGRMLPADAAEDVVSTMRWKDKEDTDGTIAEMTWTEFVEFLSRPMPRPPGYVAACARGDTKNGADLRAWSPATLSGSRSKKNVITVTAIVHDIDKGAHPLEVITDAFAGRRAVVHSTRSYVVSAPTWRVVSAVSRPMTSEEHVIAMRAERERLSRIGITVDPAPQHGAALFFEPVLAADGAFIAEALEGEPLDVDDVIEREAIVGQTALVPASGVREGCMPRERATLAAREPLSVEQWDGKGPWPAFPAFDDAPNAAYTQAERPDRARRILRTIEPAIEGANGHASALLAAEKLGKGMAIASFETVYALVLEWDRDNVPRFGDGAELRRKTFEGIAKGHTIAWGKLLRELPPANVRTIDDEDVAIVFEAAPATDTEADDDADPYTAPERERHLKRGDHVELAERTVEDIETRFGHRPVYAEGTIYRYASLRGLHVPIEAHELSQLVQRYAGKSVPNVDGKMKPLQLSAGSVRGALELARAQVAAPTFFDGAAKGVAFANGFVQVDASSIVVRNHAASHRARQGYAFALDDGAKAPRFFELLAQWFEGDADAFEKTRLLLEFFGACLLGLATRYQLGLVLVGAGANGKSTLIDIISDVMPNGSSVAIPPNKMKDELVVMTLAGKLVNIVAELPKAKVHESEIVKAAITGDAINGRWIGGNGTTFRPIAGHVFSANALPQVDDDSAGFWRRFAVVPFNRKFTGSGAKANLREEVARDERAGILTAMLQGARRLVARGRYEIPESSTKALEAWRRESNPVALFVSEMTRPRADGEPSVSATSLYNAFRTWAEANGHEPIASNAFGAKLKTAGHPSHRTKTGAVYPLALVEVTDQVTEVTNR